MPVSTEQQAWVQRVLGFASAAAPQAASGQAAVAAIWRDAKEAVDARLEALANELRSHDDADADQIAEFGLFGLTGGGETVGLVAALMQYDAAAPDGRAAAGAALGQAVAAYRTVLDSNPAVELVDDNPFGVAVALRDTLGGALTQIEAASA